MHVNIYYCSLQVNTSSALSITIGQRPYELNKRVVQGMRWRTSWILSTATLSDTTSLTEADLQFTTGFDISREVPVSGWLWAS
jgi:hypothetical protein